MHELRVNLGPVLRRVGNIRGAVQLLLMAQSVQNVPGQRHTTDFPLHSRESAANIVSLTV
ncbi:uncharacterized protein V6R79_005310 [Siganus canaliculatus]